jgi:hypothetical protein
MGRFSGSMIAAGPAAETLSGSDPQTGISPNPAMAWTGAVTALMFAAHRVERGRRARGASPEVFVLAFGLFPLRTRSAFFCSA